jgi:heme exporter protein C
MQSILEKAFVAAPWLALLGGLALGACQWLIFVYAPVEATLGVAQKIFYLHLPLAWWGLISFFVVFVSSIAYIYSRQPYWDALAGSVAEIGLLMAVLSVVTGSIWARHSWGVWWTWDARLTTALIMCFIYAGYLIIRGMSMQPDRKALIASVVGIVAFLDVPLVFFSARLWSYIHPSSVTLEPEMRLTVMACIGALALLWTGLVLFRFRLALDEQRLTRIAMERLMRQ